MSTEGAGGVKKEHISVVVILEQSVTMMLSGKCRRLGLLSYSIAAENGGRDVLIRKQSRSSGLEQDMDCTPSSA